MASMVLIPDLKATFDLKASGKKLDAARNLGEKCDGDVKYVFFGHTVGDVLKPEERDLYGQFEGYFGKELSFKARCRKAESPIGETEEILSEFYKKMIGSLHRHDGIEDVIYGEVKKRAEDIYCSIKEYLGKEKTVIVSDSFIALPHESKSTQNFEFDGRMVSCVPGVPENSELPKKEYLEKKTDYKIDKERVRNAKIVIANNLPFVKLFLPESEQNGIIFIGPGKKHAIMPSHGSLTIYENGMSAYTTDLSEPLSLGIVNFRQGKRTATAVNLETLEYLQKSKPMETTEAVARFGIKDFLLAAATGGLIATLLLGGVHLNYRRQNEELRQELKKQRGEKQMLKEKIWVIEQKTKVDNLTKRIEKMEDELGI
ncbi:MAG: hypothetical protein PVG65_00995 [Candidatus Thorarchaeota archaeon]